MYAICMHLLLRVRLWSAGVSHLVVASAALLAAVSLVTSSVNALETNANTAESGWCVEQAGSGDPPSCVYGNFLTCGMAAITTGGSCKPRSSLPVAATERKPVTRASSHRAPVSVARNTRATAVRPAPTASRMSALSAAEREKLFRDFVQWRRQRSDP